MCLVLVYHKVTPRREIGFNSIKPHVFEDQVRLLKSLGYSSLTVSDSIRLGNVDRNVVIMFDDAYEETCFYAENILRSYGYVANVAVITDFVGRENSWDAQLGTPFRHMPWEQIGSLHKEGWEIVSHTCSHRALTLLTREQIARELADSRDVLEAQLGIPVRHVVYPYGRANKRVVRAAAAAGYVSASGYFGSGLFNLPRTPIYSSDNADVFVDKLRENKAELIKSRLINFCSVGTSMVQVLRSMMYV